MMKQLVVWVDDTRDPFSNMWNPVATNKKYISGEAVIVWLKSYDDFTSWLDTALEDKCSRFPSLFCFDHDLGEEKNGLDCAKYLVEFCLDNNINYPPAFATHRIQLEERILFHISTLIEKHLISRLMELYAKPIITTADDGTINIRVQPITPEYIETRLAELAVFGQINYNLEEVVRTIQNSSSQKQANKRLQITLGIGSAEADFLLDLTIEEIAHFSRENIEKEFARWNSMKAILEQCAENEDTWNNL